MTRTVRLLWALVALVVLATVVLAATRGRAWYDARQVQQAQRDALAAGRQLAVNFATLDYRKVDIDTRVKLNGANLGTKNTVNIDPSVYGIAYVFTL